MLCIAEFTFCALFTLLLFFDHKNVLGVKECNWLSKLIRMKSGFGFKLSLVKESSAILETKLGNLSIAKSNA